MLPALAGVCVPVCARVCVRVRACFFTQIDYGRVPRCTTKFSKMIWRAQMPSRKTLGRGQRWVETWSNMCFHKGFYIFQSPYATMVSLCAPSPNFSMREIRKLRPGSVLAQYWGERIRFGISWLALKLLLCFSSWVTLDKLLNFSELALTFSHNVANTDAKAYVLYDIIYMTFQSRQSCRDRETVVSRG